MLSDIERDGMDAVLRYAAELDGFHGSSLEVSERDIERAADELPRDLREALDAGAERTRRFA
jgi:sulfopropanediol 3-dehydrogenase